MRLPFRGRGNIIFLCRHGYSTASSQHDVPLRLAVVGSGPAGFYSASRVMSRLPGTRVDLYESLPVPFGLVRHGVAPDHPEVKNCQYRFEEIAKSPNFCYIGNVSIGSAAHLSQHAVVQLETLMRHYHAILLAYGASQDKLLGIPGETQLHGIYSARQFVGWYNGHPDSVALGPDLAGAEEAIIIGQGNVALDLARVLLEDIDVLRRTDIVESALAQFARSRIKCVRVVGRRGPMQAAFTIKEVREMMSLPGTYFYPVQRSLIPDDVGKLPRASRRLMQVLLQGSQTALPDASKTWSLDSCLSPRRFLCDRHKPSVVADTEFSLTTLAVPFDPQAQAAATSQTVTLPSKIVLRSIGYKSTAIPGLAEINVSFDERRGVIENDGLGRVMGRKTSPSGDGPHADRAPVAGLYCAGWIKSGPTGIIATTMQDAFATGDAIVQDWQAGVGFLGQGHDDGSRRQGWEAVRQEVGITSSVSWDQWRMIDAAEKERGEKVGKSRVKFTSTADMLSVI